MRHFKAPALLFATLIAVTGTALAGGGGDGGGGGKVDATVAALSPQVTYSTEASVSPPRPALQTTVGYSVQIRNKGRSTVSDIRFIGTISVTDRNEVATLTSIEGLDTCTASGNTIRCSIDQLRPGQSLPFKVFYAAPVKDRRSPLPDGDLDRCDRTDCVKFSASVESADHGYGGHSWSYPDSSSTSAYVALVAPSADSVHTAVPKTGGTYFTGDGVPTGDDVFTTLVDVPAGPASTFLDIVESTSKAKRHSYCTNFPECPRTDITIPGTFNPYLKIVLRLDSSLVRRGLHINSVLIHYYPDNGGVYTVGECASPTTPNSNGIPCIAKRVVYKKNRDDDDHHGHHDHDGHDGSDRSGDGSSDSARSGGGGHDDDGSSDLEGDFEWTLLNIKNGGYAID